jgi:nicotinamide mononucleotide (NMN) deamidase PncC
MSDLAAALAQRVLKKAKAAGVKLATAGSCTAGRLATLFADAPGAGEHFRGGFVTDTKQNKIATLGVLRQLIPAHTAAADWWPTAVAPSGEGPGGTSTTMARSARAGAVGARSRVPD